MARRGRERRQRQQWIGCVGLRATAPVRLRRLPLLGLRPQQRQIIICEREHGREHGHERRLLRRVLPQREVLDQQILDIFQIRRVATQAAPRVLELLLAREELRS